MKVFTEAPIQYGIGFETPVTRRLSVSLQAGVLTQPYSSVILNLLESFGTDPNITLMINDAFTFGLVAEGGVNYHYKKNYVGLFCQGIVLKAGDTPTSLVENYFGEDVSTYPRRGRLSTAPVSLQLKSTLYQGGFLYGRRFPLRDSRFGIFSELAISANLSSRSSLSVDSYDLSALSAVVEDELAYYYANYCFIPTLTVGFTWKPDATHATK